MPLDAATAAAGINAGGSLLTSVVNTVYDAIQQNRQRQWNETMMDKQNEWSLNMWNKTNQYNSPSAQLQRLRDAGLNPLYYGLDGSSAQAFQSAQPLGYDRASAPAGMMNPFTDFLDAKKSVSQIDNINADTAYKSNLSLSEIERRQNLKVERDQMRQDIVESISKSNLNDKEREKLEQYMEYADEMYQAAIDKDYSISSLNASQRNRIEHLLPGELELQQMTKQDFRQKWRSWSAEIDHMANQDKLLAKQGKYYLFTLLQNGWKGTGVSFINTLLSAWIAEDDDLNPKEKEAIFKVIEGKTKPSSNSGYHRSFFPEIGDMADPLGNFFGPTF